MKKSELKSKNDLVYDLVYPIKSYINNSFSIILVHNYYYFIK